MKYNIKEAMIKFDKVTKIYKGDFKALEDINLEIQPGEFVSIVGKSGAGKSTLLKLIYAEEMPTMGNVFFDKKPIDGIKRRLIHEHRKKIGTVFQDFKLLPKKTAFENVAYALEVSGVSQAEILEDVPQILDIVGLGNKMEKFPHQLSGGEQQRVAFARALSHNPKIIIADEPTGNLDPISSWEIVQLMLKVNEIGTTIILASHDKYVVDKINKRIVVIENGKIIGDYPTGKYKLN
jgi:cell division transport system ATP-binding protein